MRMYRIKDTLVFIVDEIFNVRNERGELEAT